MRPARPPFTEETATEKVRLDEDGWNSRDPEKVSLAYTPDSCWRNRDLFIVGRLDITRFLESKWEKERGYRLVKELFAFHENRIAVRCAYEFHDSAGAWFRAYGNENWIFAENGLMHRRHASIKDVPIGEDERLFRSPQGRRPDNHPGLSELGL